jgi:hypothetical protein
MTNPDINIHLLNLVKQYKTDIETRINSLKCDSKDCVTDWELDIIKEQISHWQITLLQINEVLKECER